MTVTFLIGNGFDINNGLKTRYGDFYKTIDQSKIDNNMIYREINSKPTEWSDFEYALGNYTKSIKENPSNFMEAYNQVLNDLNDYIRKCDNTFQISRNSEIQNDFMKDLNGFQNDLPKKDMELILQNIPNSTNLGFNFLSFNYTRLLDAILEKAKGRTSLSRQNSGLTALINPCVHVHGMLDTFPIVGVSNEKQLNTELFDDFTRNLLIKPKISDSLRNGIRTQATNIIQNSSVIYIYGMSLGETDRYWWEEIGKWLQNSSNNRLIISKYSSNLKINNNPVTYLTEQRKWQNEFLKFTSVPSNKENEIRRRILFVTNPSIFNYEQFIEKKAVKLKLAN